MCHLNRKTRLILTTTLHISILSHYSIFSLYAAYTVQFIEEPLKTRLIKYTWAYLTYWNFGFQVTFLLLAAGCDAAEWTKSTNKVLYKKMQYWRDVIYSGLVVPMTTFVTTMFWGVYFIDRELVFPRAYDAVVPSWFNHSVHTITFLVIVLETLLQPRKRPVDRKMETIFYAGVSVSYAVVYYSIFLVTGMWLYQLFAIMTWWQVCGYQIMIWSSIHFFYKIQYPINRFVHGSVDDSEDVVTVGGRDVVDVRNGNSNPDNNRGKDENELTHRSEA